MVERSALIKEIDSLPPQYYNEVIDFVSFIKEKKLEKPIYWKKQQNLRLKITATTKSLHHSAYLTPKTC